MRTAITLCQVEEAAAGPFVFRQPLPEAFSLAAELGFEAVELFLPGPDWIPVEEIQKLADHHHLGIAAVGTGAGMVKHGLSLTDPDAEKRSQAREFIRGMIEYGGALQAPAILGSMQGKWGGAVSREQALDWLAESLSELGAVASQYGIPFIYEPLNRYETNLIHRLEDGVEFLVSRQIENVVLLADLFHMNIEEPDLADALIRARSHLGHVHWADSNRWAMGLGHTTLAPIAQALREIGYSGFLSAEVLPLPDPLTAARSTLASIRQSFS